MGQTGPRVAFGKESVQISMEPLFCRDIRWFGSIATVFHFRLSKPRANKWHRPRHYRHPVIHRILRGYLSLRNLAWTVAAQKRVERNVLASGAAAPCIPRLVWLVYASPPPPHVFLH